MIEELPYSVEDDARFNGDETRMWDYIATKQADILISMSKTGLDADAIFKAIGDMDGLYLHEVLSPDKVTEVIQKVIIPCIPKLKHASAEDKLNVMFRIADWLTDMGDRAGRHWTSDPRFVKTCKTGYVAFAALAKTLTREDLESAMHECRGPWTMSITLISSWNLVSGHSSTEKAVAGYFRSIYSAMWNALLRTGSDNLAADVRKEALKLAAQNRILHRVRTWLDTHAAPSNKKTRATKKQGKLVRKHDS